MGMTLFFVSDNLVTPIELELIQKTLSSTKAILEDVWQKIDPPMYARQSDLCFILPPLEF